MLKLLLLIVFFISLWVPIFNRTGPALFGFPFFYWYQIAIIFVSSFLIWVVFAVDSKKAGGK